ncbi:MAG: hypothetical protein Q4G28_05995 [Neisseria sp.]|nr:hypothetical protein [Neisseria sp.]
MKITLNNAVKNWKALLLIILAVQTLMLLLYTIAGIKEVFSFSYSDLSSLISAPVFFLYLHFKKEDA